MNVDSDLHVQSNLRSFLLLLKCNGTAERRAVRIASVETGKLFQQVDLL
jgi:hypothetical protein